MKSALKDLIKLMPPPAEAPNRDVDWGRLETSIGLKYPDSFREFIGAYGSSVWFDHATPFYATAKTTSDAQQFLISVKSKLKPLETNLFDQDQEELELPLYPEKGGLFPFMIDYSSSLYCWRTERKEPNEWPIYCWFTGQIVVLRKMSITQMFLKWLQRKPPMLDLWGDVNDLPPEQVRLTDPTEAKKGRHKKEVISIPKAGDCASWTKTLTKEKEPPDRAAHQNRAAAHVSKTGENVGSPDKPAAQRAAFAVLYKNVDRHKT